MTAGRETGRRGTLRILTLILLLFLFSPFARAADVRIAWDPARVTPGGVVAIHLWSPFKLLSCSALLGSEQFPLIREKNGSFVALVGIDADKEETSVPVDFELFPLQGKTPLYVRADLIVRRDGEKPVVQNLSLPTGMVEFSPERLEQIRRDRTELGESLAARTPGRFWEKGFLVPVDGRISTRFGVRRVLNGQPRSPHAGVDIAASLGTPIRASNGGKVLLAENLFLTGETVVLDHGWGVSTLYGHLDRISVAGGGEVERGQVVGTVGATGRATGPHLHFSAFLRGVKVDPLELIEATAGISGIREQAVE